MFASEPYFYSSVTASSASRPAFKFGCLYPTHAPIALAKATSIHFVARAEDSLDFVVGSIYGWLTMLNIIRDSNGPSAPYLMSGPMLFVLLYDTLLMCRPTRPKVPTQVMVVSGNEWPIWELLSAGHWRQPRASQGHRSASMWMPLAPADLSVALQPSAQSIWCQIQPSTQHLGVLLESSETGACLQQTNSTR